MKDVTILLLGHKARRGKDSAADALIEKNYSIQRFGFADKLKEVVADLYNFSDDQMYGVTKDAPDIRYTKSRDNIILVKAENLNDDENGHILRSGYFNSDGSRHTEGQPLYYKAFESYTPREVLQDFGQEQRSRYPMMWADYVYREIESMVLNPSTEDREFVITDFRFPNEYDSGVRLIHRLRDKGIKVNLYPVRILRNDLPDFDGMYNESETALDDFNQWHMEIVNDADDLAGWHQKVINTLLPYYD